MTAAGRGARRRAGAVLLGAFVGASIWVSAGVLALVDPVKLTRVAALPGWAWLIGLAAGGAVTGGLVPALAAAWPAVTLLVLLWLPWLPWSVPDAFLMWEGPLEGAVWAAAVAAVAWSWRRPGPMPPALTGRRAPFVAAALAALIFAGAWFAVRPRVPVGDEPHYLVITQSLLRDGDLRIENNHTSSQYLDYYEGVLKPDFRRRGTDRQIYSIHAPGVSALVAPAFALFGYPGAVLAVIAMVAAGTALVWQAAFVLTGSAAAAWAGWAALTCAAPFLLHAFTIYPDGPGAAATMVAVLALVWLDQGRAVAAPAWIGVGAALALLPWLHTRFAVVAAVLGLILSLRLMRAPAPWRTVPRLLAVPALAAVGWFSYFWSIYGTFSPTAPYGVAESELGVIPAGLAGLLFDQQFGLVTNAPVLAVGLLGLAVLALRRPRLAVEATVLCAGYLTAVATYPMWWGGNSAPARFAVIVLPLLGLPVAEVWARVPLARTAIRAALAVTAAISLTLVAVDRGAFVFNGRDGYSLLLTWLSQSTDLTLAVPSVHRDGAGPALLDAGVWLAVTALVMAVAAWCATTWPGRAVSRAAALLAVPVVLMLASSVVWAGLRRPALTATTSQMEFLGRWSPARLALAVQLVPTRWLTADEVPRRLVLATSMRGARPAGQAPLLVLPRVLAGDYDVFAEGRAPLDGTLTVRLGRQSAPIDVWPLAGRPIGFTGLTLSLPALAHSISIEGDGAALAGLTAITLRPRVVEPPERSVYSPRAARFGRVVAFMLDDNAYLEPDALWVRGVQAAQMVLRADAGTRPVLHLQGGPVANVVTVAAGEWRQEVALAPGASADVTLPTAALAPAALTITSESGFRPIDFAADSRDGRHLGVYVTWPVAPVAPAQNLSVPPK